MKPRYFRTSTASLRIWLHATACRNASATWNVSLFHYRMHGSDFGRVLVGFEIPSGDEARFQAFLDNLHYNYEEVTQDPVYRLFL